MCGIAGVIGKDEAAVRKALSAMVAAQCHRGPDDSGETLLPFGDRLLGLGQRRLSIIDLSPAGHQPMVHPETRDQLIFNGEIYNFLQIRRELEAAGQTFFGHSDTECLLYGLSRWGPSFISKLQGMFAFAYYHAASRSLLLARDSVGIKPLYLAESNGTMVFASEVGGVLASGLIDKKLDLQGVAGLLAYGAVQQPVTMFKGVRSFPSGCYQEFHAHGNGASHTPTPFWTYPEVKNGIGQAQAVAAIESTLDAAVRDHLIADVPVGVFLSSGLDSTVVAGLAARHTSQLRSFSVGFSDQPDMSEHAEASETAKLFGLVHTPIDIGSRDAEMAAMKWLGSLDQPSVDGLNVYVISEVVRRQGITVALSGQGGDELFGGYPSFRDVPRLQRIMRYVCALPGPMRRAFAAAAMWNRSAAVKQKFLDVVNTDGSLLELYLQRRRTLSDAQMATLGLSPRKLGLTRGWLPPDALAGWTVAGKDPVWAMSQLECRFYQANMLLRDSDANGMAHSLEIRVPMLDQRVLDLMLPMPGSLKLPDGIANKHLLRVAFAPLLRPALLAQKKRGFSLPIRRWMLGPLRDLCDHSLARLKNVGAMDPRGIDAIWNAFLEDPESPIWSRAFTLCVLGMYLDRHRVTA